MPGLQLLHLLPDELREDILQRLSWRDLTTFNLTSRWAYERATPHVWREVELVDCKTQHEDGVFDDHDDSPLIRKLILLATYVTHGYLRTVLRTTPLSPVLVVRIRFAASLIFPFMNFSAFSTYLHIFCACQEQLQSN